VAIFPACCFLGFSVASLTEQAARILETIDITCTLRHHTRSQNSQWCLLLLAYRLFKPLTSSIDLTITHPAHLSSQ